MRSRVGRRANVEDVRSCCGTPPSGASRCVRATVFKQAKTLREAGIAPSDADALAKGLAIAEGKLPAAQRAKFSTFDGVVRMDATGQHPPAQRH